MADDEGEDIYAALGRLRAEKDTGKVRRDGTRERPGQRMFNSTRWKHVRAHQLNTHPTCELCAKEGRVTGASIVDHRTPHHGDERLFWDPTNLQSLCKLCHDSTKRRAEHGSVQQLDEDGWPT